jgi:hypothetical protein
MTARTFTFTVASPPPVGGGGPSWWDTTRFPEKAWRVVPNTATRTPIQALREPQQYGGENPAGTGNDQDITDANMGGTVDQLTGNIVFCGNGGHGNWYGNETLACWLREANESNVGWYRMNDHSPREMCSAIALSPDITNAVNGATTVFTIVQTLSAGEQAHYGSGSVWVSFSSASNGGFVGTGWSGLNSTTARIVSVPSANTVEIAVNSSGFPAYVPGTTRGEFGTISMSNNLAAMGGNPNLYRAAFRDGRCRSQHTANVPKTFGGKVWFGTQPAPSGSGNSTFHSWSFDLNHAGLAHGFSQTPLAWTNDAGPWEWLGSTGTGDKSDSATTATLNGGTGPYSHSEIDPVNGYCYSFHAGNPTSRWCRMDVTGSRTPQTVTFTGPGVSYNSVWSCAVVDPQWDGVVGDPNNTCRWAFIVLGSGGNVVGQMETLRALDVKAGSPTFNQWRTITCAGLPHNQTMIDFFGVYHKPSRAILLGRVQNKVPGYATTAGTLTLPNVYKIRVATNASGTYAGDKWTLSQIKLQNDPNTPIKTSSVVPATDGYTGWGSYSKFNIVQDMGNGQACLTLIPQHNEPTYFCRLPTTEIF